MVRSSMFAAVMAVLSATPVLAQNVALNKPVTIISGAGSLYGPAVPFDVVTDGLFLGETTAYSHPAADIGSVRWNTTVAGSATLEIQLGDLFTIDGIIAQADDNDALLVSYLGADNAFHPLYNVPFVSVGWGFVTRPSSDQVTFAPLTPVNTTTIRITDAGGDGYYGISELQLRGVLVPAPTAFGMLATAGLMTLRRRRA